MNAEQFRKAGHELIDFIADYMGSIEQHPVRNTSVQPNDIKKLLPPSPPQDAQSWDLIRKDIDTVVMPHLTHWQSPNFFAFFPSNGSYPGILGELLSAGLGQQGMMWITSPALTELEQVMLDWLVQMLALPEVFLSTSGTGGGVIQNTASDSVLCVLLAAKYRTAELHGLDAQQDATVAQRVVVYCSDQTHSSIKRALIIAGIPLPNFRPLVTDAAHNYAIDPVQLEQAIQADIAAGLWPSCVVSCVGTTGCGAVDPVQEIGLIARKYNLWHHCDAAWAGSAMICPEFRVTGTDLLDSFNFNPHKWLLVNFDCSCMWVRDKKSLTSSMAVLPEYLRNKASEGGATDFKDWHVQLGRRFRALKLWFVIRSYGVTGLQQYIRSHIVFATTLEDKLRADSRVEVLSRSLSLILFRIRDSDEKTKTLLERLNERGAVYLTHVLMSGKYFIRIAIGSASTQQQHVDRLYDLIQQHVEEVTKQ
jgi:aromatic-L-amino-acid decarboxylase